MLLMLRCFVFLVVLSSVVCRLGSFGPAWAAEEPKRCEPAKLAVKYPSLAGKTIRVGVSAESRPWTLRDPKNLDNVIGLDVDLARAAFACIGARYEFAVGAWSGLLPSVIAGQTDLMWDHLFYTPERAKAADFVVYMVGASGAVVVKGNPKNVRALDKLCGFRAGAIVGALEDKKLRELDQACATAGKPAIQIINFTDRSSGLRLLENDRADLFLGIGDDSGFDASRFERAFRFRTDIKVGVGVTKGNRDLETALRDALVVMQANGLERKIYADYDVDHAVSIPVEVLLQ